MAEYGVSARGGGGGGGGGGSSGGGAGEAMMMVVVADDRAPGLLPPRKRLLAGLKHNRNPSTSPLPRPPAPTIATNQAMADPRFISASHNFIHGFVQQCSSCGLTDPRLLLHRLGSPPRVLCSSCVLSFHKHMYCFLCLQVFKEQAQRSACLTCRNCQRLSHLQCARKRWPPAFDCANSATTLCADCGKPGSGSTPLRIGENLLHAGDDRCDAMEPSSKRQRTGRVCPDDIRSKWLSCDLMQRASQELPLVDQEALAAAKVVAAIAEKGARDAKRRAVAAAAAAAKASARAKLALDNAYKAGQEEAVAQSEAEELPQLEGSSDPPAGEPIMQQQAVMSVELARQRSPISVPRNSRSSAPVHKRRTLSAIVASEESRAQANLLGNQGVCLPVVKQQPRRPRSDTSRRYFAAPYAGRTQASSSQSSIAGIGPPLPATFTPCSSQSGTPQAPASSARLAGVSTPSPPSVIANVPQGSPEACGSTVVSPWAHPTNLSQFPASVLHVTSMKRRKLVPSVETPGQEIRQETPGFAAGAHDLNLPAEGLTTLSEYSPSIECLTSPHAVLSHASRLHEADALRRLEMSGGVSDDEQVEKTTREDLIPHASQDATSIALESSTGPPLQNRNNKVLTASCSIAENGEFDEACLEGSYFQSGQCADVDLGRLEIVLPVIDSVRESPEGCVDTNGAYHGNEATLLEGQFLPTCSSDKSLGKIAVIGSLPASASLNFRDGISSGAGKGKIHNHLGEPSCMRLIEEQENIRGIAGAGIKEIISKPRSQLQGVHHFLISSCLDSDNGNDPASMSKRSVASSFPAPLQGAAVTGSPLELARNG